MNVSHKVGLQSEHESAWYVDTLCYRYVYDIENDERHVERESHRLGVVCKVGKSNTAAETELGPMTRR